MPVGIGADLILLALIAISFGIYKHCKNDDEIFEYEDSFIQEHINHIPSSLLKLEFDGGDTEYFFKICSYVVKKNKLDRHKVQLENHFLTFRKAVSHSYYVEMIRCTKSLAIIAATGYHHCAYILKETKTFKEIDDTKFRIYDKFCYFDQSKDRPQITEEQRVNYEKQLPGITDTESELEREVDRNPELGERTPIPHPEEYQVRHVNPESRYPAENLRPVYVPVTESFDRSKSVRRWSSAERDIYDADRGPRRIVSSDEERDIMYPGYQRHLQHGPYPPYPAYNAHPAQVVDYQADVVDAQRPPDTMPRH